MAKKIFASVPDTIADELQDWADQQGRSLSSLISYMLENSLRAAKEKGEYQPNPSAIKRR
jgi:hypothetical protein